jgi:NADH dehydrogenase
MTRSTLFVTGASGFLGRALLSRLPTSLAPDVICLSRSLAAAAERKAAFVQGTLEQPTKYAPALKECEAVIHLAACSRRARPATYQRVNVEGTRALLEASARSGVKRFLFLSCASTADASGRYGARARSKLQAEELVRASALDWTILRTTLVFGYRSPIQRSLTNLATARITPLFCGGRAQVQPIWSDDAADVLVEWVEGRLPSRETIDVGGPESISLRDLLQRMARKHAGREPRFVPWSLGATQACLALLERPFLELAPASAASLELFRRGRAAQPNAWLEARRVGMVRIDEMLQRFLDGPEQHPFAGH